MRKRSRSSFLLALALIILVILFFTVGRQDYDFEHFVPSEVQARFGGLLPQGFKQYGNRFMSTAIHDKPGKKDASAQNPLIAEEFDAEDDDIDDQDDDIEADQDQASLGVYDEKNDGEPFTDKGDSYDIYHQLYSISQPSRKYFAIHMDGIPTFNGNLIPHPTRVDMWIAAASHAESDKVQTLSCSVGDLNGVLVCGESPTPLPIQQQVDGECEGEKLFLFNHYSGPRDLRLFWGPDTPYVTFGAPSRFGCLGQWIQDARELLVDYKIQSVTGNRLFHSPIELQRPKSANVTRSTVEKNYFVFWDANGASYVHYSIWPQRSFAKLDFDGSVGPDLAPLAKSDRRCLMEHMPLLNTSRWFDEKLHQATNSLLVTLCKRRDPMCTPTANNTYLMHVFHRRRYGGYHATYQPYVMLFEQKPPFALYGIGKKALWIHGRSLLSEKSGIPMYQENPLTIPQNQSEMFFMTSMSWKTHGQKYHGYLDDPIWLNFGREDSQAGSIDVYAEDMIQDLALCGEELL